MGRQKDIAPNTAKGNLFRVYDSGFLELMHDLYTQRASGSLDPRIICARAPPSITKDVGDIAISSGQPPRSELLAPKFRARVEHLYI